MLVEDWAYSQNTTARRPGDSWGKSHTTVGTTRWPASTPSLCVEASHTPQYGREDDQLQHNHYVITTQLRDSLKWSSWWGDFSSSSVIMFNAAAHHISPYAAVFDVLFNRFTIMSAKYTNTEISITRYVYDVFNVVLTIYYFYRLLYTFLSDICSRHPSPTMDPQNYNCLLSWILLMN